MLSVACMGSYRSREKGRECLTDLESLGKFNAFTQKTVLQVFCTLCYIRQQRREMNRNRERTAKPRMQEVAMPISSEQANGQGLARAVPRRCCLFRLR